MYFSIFLVSVFKITDFFYFFLDKSMLERLMSLPLYCKRPSTNRYDANVLTKLVLNYRSHQAILKVSNDLFYDGDLEVNFNFGTLPS